MILGVETIAHMDYSKLGSTSGFPLFMETTFLSASQSLQLPRSSKTACTIFGNAALLHSTACWKVLGTS